MEVSFDDSHTADLVGKWVLEIDADQQICGFGLQFRASFQTLWQLHRWDGRGSNVTLLCCKQWGIMHMLNHASCVIPGVRRQITFQTCMMNWTISKGMLWRQKTWLTRSSAVSQAVGRLQRVTKCTAFENLSAIMTHQMGKNGIQALQVKGFMLLKRQKVIDKFPFCISGIAIPSISEQPLKSLVEALQCHFGEFKWRTWSLAQKVDSFWSLDLPALNPSQCLLANFCPCNSGIPWNED